jgi:hypothetical protein
MPEASGRVVVAPAKALTKDSVVAKTFPSSLENARQIILRSLEYGRVHITAHFKRRCIERRFTTVDAETIIKKGQMLGNPKYCPQFDNWCFGFVGEVDTKWLDIRVALDPQEDYDVPLIILITGFKRGSRHAE